MLVLDLIWVWVVAAALFWLPGMLWSDEPDPGRRRLVAWWGGALAVGLLATVASPFPAAPWFPAVVAAAALAGVGLRKGPRRSVTERGAGLPLGLVAVVLLYGWLRPDSLAFSTLGVLGPAVEAAGHPLGLGSELPGNLLAAPLPAPLGQIAPVVALTEALRQPAVRLWFALVMLLLAGSSFHLVGKLGGSRRLATAAGAFAVFNPITMAANHLDALGSLLPAAGLGLVLLASGRTSRAWRLAGLLLTRPVFALGAAAVLLREGGSRLRFAVLAVPASLLGLAWLAGRPVLDAGLLPLPAPSLAWWLDGLLHRAPYAAAPPWLTLPLSTLGALGTGFFAAAALGARAWWRRDPALARTTAALILPTALPLLLHGLVLQDAQMQRLSLFLVPATAAAALGLQPLFSPGRGRHAATLLALALGALVLGHAAAKLPFPASALVAETVEHLDPEPPHWPAQERARLARISPLPRYHVEHLIDPWLIGEGKRWRDARDELRHPDFAHRYPSIDETILSFIRGEAFTRRWLPDHPRLRARGHEAGPGDPYGESAPLVLDVDLGAALRDGRLEVRCAEGPAQLDAASSSGPLSSTLQIEGRRLALAVFKEAYGPTEVEVALVLGPAEWSVEHLGPPGLDLRDGRLRIAVPGRAFLSYAQILGERKDPLGLLVGQVFHVDPRCPDGAEVFGPFRQ